LGLSSEGKKTISLLLRDIQRGIFVQRKDENSFLVRFDGKKTISLLFEMVIVFRKIINAAIPGNTSGNAITRFHKN
jgi:hypothetical protein